jgi:transposase-like protein
MYFNSRSYRCTSKSPEHVIKRSHVYIWKWVQKNANVADHFRIHKHGVKEIFVDEILIQIDGKGYWLWISSSIIFI